MQQASLLRKTIASFLGQTLTPEIAAAIEISSQVRQAPANGSLNEKISYVLQDNADAVALFLAIRSVLHFWDDLIDEDKPLSKAHTNRSMFAALVVIPENPFYRKHSESLVPTLTNAIANWHTANLLEQSDDEESLRQAFVIRSDYANVLIQMAYLVGGLDWMTEVTPLIRKMWTSENFYAYLSNLQRERAAKANTHEYLVRDWYEQETAEYIESGIIVFNAAMLGTTEEEHVQRLYELIEPPKGAVIVDMGCGIGGVSAHMHCIDPTAGFFGVTNVQVQFDVMKDMGIVEPILSDYHATPLPDSCADVVMFNESIGYGHLEVLLRESYRMLKVGGVLAIKDGVSLTGFDEWSSVWQWTTYAKGKIDALAGPIGFNVEISTELDYSPNRYREFVTNNEVMRDRYGEVKVTSNVIPCYFWLLRKIGD